MYSNVSALTESSVTSVFWKLMPRSGPECAVKSVEGLSLHPVAARAAMRPIHAVLIFKDMFCGIAARLALSCAGGCTEENCNYRTVLTSFFCFLKSLPNQKLWGEKRVAASSSGTSGLAASALLPFPGPLSLRRKVRRKRHSQGNQRVGQRASTTTITPVRN